MSNGNIVRIERLKYRFNQTQVSKEAGINPASLIDIENERIGIDDVTRDKIINVIKKLTRVSTPT